MQLEDFKAIDFLFAKKIFPSGCEKAHLFLAYLLKSAREGHLCVFLNEELGPNLLEGASLLPASLFEVKLVKEDKRIYLKRNWECEKSFIFHLKRLKEQKPTLSISDDWLKKRLETEPLNAEQKKAILNAASQNLSLICGGPGTGKTFTAAVLIRLFIECGNKEIAIGAPTGKAVANMKSALGFLAEKCSFKTVHALVKKEKIHADLIVIDEGSMVDALRMMQLFAAVKEGARLILLGDKNQLPPIESGNFFADLASDPQLVSELKTCLRTDLKEILDMALQVNRGNPIPSKPLPDSKTLLSLIVKEQFHVLTPLRKGLYGVDHLNQLLYQHHQKRGAKEIPILIMENDPYLELFNGDMGILNKEDNRAYFSEGRAFPEYLLPRYDYAYVLSVHKSQGSEYERVLILLPKGSEVFGREMLYTALTRAKSHVTLLADEGVVEALVKTSNHRRSGL